MWVRAISPAAVATVLAALTGCTRTEADAGQKARGSAPIPVKVAVATQADVPVQIRAIGRVEAYATVTVRPQVDGQLMAFHFTEGQDVKQGDLLYDIDPRPFQAALEQAQGTLAKDQALAEDADREAEWEAGLLKQNAAAQREYEQARASADSLHAATQADQAAVDRARLNLEYCAIHSPLDGRTGARLADPGNIVTANQTALVVINQLNPIYVTFAVPEQNLVKINDYRALAPLTVTAVIDPNEGMTEQGVLTFVDNTVDRTTGMITLKGTFPNEDRRLWPGLFVSAVLTLTTRPQAVVVPSQAVQTGQSGQYIFIVKDDRTVESRPVVTGPAMADRIVIESGVGAGETVVTDGQLRLVAGAKVAPAEAVSTAQAGAARRPATATQPVSSKHGATATQESGS